MSSVGPMLLTMLMACAWVLGSGRRMAVSDAVTRVTLVTWVTRVGVNQGSLQEARAAVVAL